MNETQKAPFYQRKWFAFLCLFFFPPAGIALLWIFHSDMKRHTKVILTIIGILWLIVLSVSKNTDSQSNLQETGQSQSETTISESNSSNNVEAETQEKQIESPLLSYEVKEGDLMNGPKTKAVGTYAYIEIPADVLDSITPEDISAFAEKRVSDSNYNYFSIVGDNGKGICFEGSQIYSASYGILADNNAVETKLGTWIYSVDSASYSFEKVKNADKKEAAAIKKKKKQAKEEAKRAEKLEQMLIFDNDKFHGTYVAIMNSIINANLNVDTHTILGEWTFVDFSDKDDGVLIGMTKVDVDGMAAKQDVVCVFQAKPDYSYICHYLYCTDLIIDDGFADEVMETFGMPTLNQ